MAQMTDSKQPQTQPTHAWHTLNWIWSAVFFGVLLISFTVVVIDDPSAKVWSRALPLLVMMGGLHWFVVHKRIKGRDHDPRYLVEPVLYILALISLWFFTAQIHPAFFIILFVLFNQIYTAVPFIAAAPLSLLLALVTAYLIQTNGGLSFSLLHGTTIYMVISSLAGSLLAFWIGNVISQSKKRQELIEELQLARQELVQSEHNAGMMAERQRLAHEIHDTLAQGFTSIVMHLEAAEQALAPNQPRAHKHLNQARETARNSLEQARRVVEDLRPQPLENSTFPEAIERVVTNWAAQSGVAGVTAVTGDVIMISAETEITLLRATQEALSNIHKHAQATEANLTLSYMADVVVLDIQDNGSGSTSTGVAKPLSGGYGLIAMRERVEKLGGSLLLESIPGEGTTVVIEIPI